MQIESERWSLMTAERAYDAPAIAHRAAAGLLGSAQRALANVGMAGRLLRDLPRFLQSPITVEQAAAVVKRRLETRPERFLLMVERSIYGHPRSPYLQLLQAAGCERGDLEALVGQEGLEGALTRLAAAGVCLSFGEFKGREQVVRGSRRFNFTESDFDTPHLAVHFDMRSGGTRGPSTTLKTSLEYLADRAPGDALALEAHGISGVDHVIWRTRPIRQLLHAKVGQPPVAWYYPLRPLPREIFAGAWYLVALSRLAGRPLPAPRFLDLREPERLTDWLVARRQEGRSICVTARGSSAVRIADAAGRMGVSLAGVSFVLAGEPCTDAKRRAIEASGARVLVRYSVMEAGAIGYGCVAPRVADDLHFLRDSYALIQRRRAVGDAGVSVDAFLLTSLLTSGPKVLLNVENGDYGVLERRPCGCQLEALGLVDHLSEIRSFEKLTSEGMTFVKTHLLRVLEEALPERYGGTSADYQVVEETDRNGILRLYLLVSPSVGQVDEGELKQTFLAELARSGDLEEYMGKVWERAGTVEIRRQVPLATEAGKVFPLHLVKNRVS